MSENLKQTPLKAIHLSHGAKLVGFAGWEMPINYGSQIEEHHTVRQAVGLFDVSHMGIVDIKGAQAFDFLRYLVANDVAKLVDGKAQYSCMLDEKGGVIDDLIIYQINRQYYRIVINAGTCQKDLAWIEKVVKDFDCTVNYLNHWGMIALQGPKAIDTLQKVLPILGATASQLKPFHFALDNGSTEGLTVARTGYTGEDGVELMGPASEIIVLTEELLIAGAKLCGLGARDTLRLEAGMSLYGQEMDESVTPIEAGLLWTVDTKDLARDFIGKKPLLSQTPRWQTLGLVALEKQGIFRGHQTIETPSGQGELSSGGFSPTMERSMGLARLPLAVKEGDTVHVMIRNNPVPAKVVAPAMVRHGKIRVTL